MYYLQAMGTLPHFNRFLEANSERIETHLVCDFRGPAPWVDFLHTVEQLWNLVVSPTVPWYYSPQSGGWRQHFSATR